MKLRVENVLLSKRKSEVKAIYMQAFEKEDRMPFWLMLAMSCLWHTQFLAFYDGETLCGLVYMATLLRQTFIMFFAVDEKLRNKGYGSRILEEVRELKQGGKTIVTIEPCEKNAPGLELRLRRRGFYMRNGYSRTGYYIRLAGKPQEILVRDGAFSKSQFFFFFLLYGCFAVIPAIWKVDE